MKRTFKFIYIFLISILFAQQCFCANSTSKGNNSIKKTPNYKVVVPPVLSLDTRTSLARNEINIINKDKLNNLSKFKKTYYKEINTMGIKYTTKWISRLKDVADEIKKHPNSIVILEGFRNTEMSSKENEDLSKQHTLFIASILRDLYRVNYTMAAIGRGIEKNDELNYNCVIITLIKDINPTQSIQ